ncbi:MAG: lipopolysaccharide biosynthesis protein [Verrucomicrobiota bacterium]|jgi:O-antigen/teichoic acid export membrane protein
MSIKHKAVNAVIWSGLERLSGQLIRFAIGVILARLLVPAEFGLIGMLGIFIGVAQVFVNCGFGEGLIQKQNATHRDECSVFYFNIAFGVFAGCLLYVAAPWIANFYRQPILTSLARLMALDVVINSFGIVQTMLLNKEIDFKTQLKVSVVSTVISGGIAVGMALQGFGVLSLAFQALIGDVLRVILLWAWHDWRPSAAFSFSSLRELLPYGSRLFASNLLNNIFTEIYSLVIGRIYTPAALGLFTRAKQMQQLPVDNLCSIVGRVSFPIFASVQQDKTVLKRGVRKAARGLVMINFPAMIGLAVTARPLVLVLLTKKWEACVPYIQLLCVGGALYPLSLIHLNALAAQGRSDLFLRLEIIKKMFVVAAVALSFRHGVKGLLIGDIVVSIISCYLNSYYSIRLIGYSWEEQILDLLPYLGISALMGVCVWLAGGLPPWGGNFSRLAAEVATGMIVYFLGCRVCRLSAFSEACEVVSSRVSRWKPA